MDEYPILRKVNDYLEICKSVIVQTSRLRKNYNPQTKDTDSIFLAYLDSSIEGLLGDRKVIENVSKEFEINPVETFREWKRRVEEGVNSGQPGLEKIALNEIESEEKKVKTVLLEVNQRSNTLLGED
jgi:transposase-like protein